MEQLPQSVKEVFFTLVSIGISALFLYIYFVLYLNPERRRSKLRRQGIRGPPTSFIYGNIPDMKRIQSTVTKPSSSSSSSIKEHISHYWVPTLFPYFEQWRNEYGPIFMYSTGNIQLLYISNPDVVKNISLCTSLNLGKPSFLRKDRGPLLGQGIMSSNGSFWAHQKKIIAPELNISKVKGMVDLMVDCTTSLINSWVSKIESKGVITDIRVDEDLRSFSADIIAKACFGSSYSKGEEIFSKLRTLRNVMSNLSLHIGVPASRYIPTSDNREMWRLEKEIHKLILKLVKERKEAGQEMDLLQMILEGASNGGELGGLKTIDRFIVDNCKNIYFAGHETTATTASWTLMLLALYPEWQARVRAELLEICEGRSPDAHMLHKMKTLTMVIQEALRLYPPAAFVAREALKEMKFGDILVPKGVNIWIPAASMHQDSDIWGPDAHNFNPERFANGILGACKFPQAYMPFGVGPRTCVGQNFAMVQVKIVLSLILATFSFSLSPKYRHSPAFKLVIEPEYGVNLLMSKA